jgi:hypothetical protein
MPEILTTSATISCQHGGRAILSSSQHHIFVNGKRILIQSDVHKIVLCPINPPPPTNSPCVKIKWSSGSQYSKNHGIRILTTGSVGKCYDRNMVFRGNAVISSTQDKVLTNG